MVDRGIRGGEGRETERGAVLRRRRWLLVTAALVGVAAAVVIAVWFEPQALFINQVVDEALPEVDAGAVNAPAGPVAPAEASASEAGATAPPAGPSATAGSSTPVPTAEQPQPGILLQGEFSSRHRYTVTGTATLHVLADGSRVVRLEDFESTNGPDLFVYLTAADSAEDDAALAADFVDLGVLRGNIGNQNYAVPDDVDLARYDTVVIWCRRFTRGFGAADLVPVT